MLFACAPKKDDPIPIPRPSHISALGRVNVKPDEFIFERVPFGDIFDHFAVFGGEKDDVIVQVLIISQQRGDDVARWRKRNREGMILGIHRVFWTYRGAVVFGIFSHQERLVFGA